MRDILYCSIAGSNAETKANAFTLSELTLHSETTVSVSSVVTELDVSPTDIVLALEQSTDTMAAYTFTGTLPSFTSTSATLSVSGNNPRGSCFNSDGTKFYVTGTDAYIRGYDIPLPTPPTPNVNAYNISLASISSSKSGIGYGGQGLFLKPDGTILYVVESANVRTLTLTTPYDVSSYSSSTTSISSVVDSDGDTISGLTGIRFNNDGTKFFVCYRKSQGTYVTTANRAKIAEFSLSTPYDVSSYTFVSSMDFGLNIGIQVAPDTTTLPAGFAWNANGTALFVAGVHQDTTQSAVKVLMYS